MRKTWANKIKPFQFFGAMYISSKMSTYIRISEMQNVDKAGNIFQLTAYIALAPQDSTPHTCYVTWQWLSYVTL
jgi:hypothetical protein